MDPLLQLVMLVAVRALHFWAVATMLGGAGLVLLLRRPLGPWPGRVLRGAAVLAAVTGLAWFALVFIDVTGDPAGLRDADLWSAFMTSVFGPPWAVQLILSCIAAALVVTSRPVAFLIVGSLIALDQAWLGHAAASAGASATWPITFYWLHVLSGLSWTGALAMLCVIGVAERRMPCDGLRLFSDIGVVLVATILASGIVNASFRLTTIADMVTTPYGEVLSVKIVLFAVMVGLAALNRREARLAEASSRRLALDVGLETAVGFAVLAAAAVLGISAPPA